MIDLRTIDDKCFAKDMLLAGTIVPCGALKYPEPGCSVNCPFYKPTGCEDWIRVGYDLIPPEVYYAEPEEGEKQLYWHINEKPICKAKE